MVLVKELECFHLLCLSKIDREKAFADLLDGKKPFKTITTSLYEEQKRG